MMRQHGFGMAELLVAMTVGLLVLLLAGALLVSSNRAWLAQAEAAGVEDGGRQLGPGRDRHRLRRRGPAAHRRAR
jgi:prepilin-type N-terminal cleavage/methylation domain-containing protein